MDFSALAAGQYGNPMAAAGIQALTNAISGGGGGGSNPYLAQALKQRQAGQGQPQVGSPNMATPAVPGAPPEQMPAGGSGQSPFMQQQGPQGMPAQGGADPQMMQQLMQLMAARGQGG